jgi:hypothetical protein
LRRKKLQVILSLNGLRILRACNIICVNGHNMITFKESYIWPKEKKTKKIKLICF